MDPPRRPLRIVAPGACHGRPRGFLLRPQFSRVALADAAPGFSCSGQGARERAPWPAVGEGAGCRWDSELPAAPPLRPPGGPGAGERLLLIAPAGCAVLVGAKAAGVLLGSSAGGRVLAPPGGRRREIGFSFAPALNRSTLLGWADMLVSPGPRGTITQVPRGPLLHTPQHALPPRCRIRTPRAVPPPHAPPARSADLPAQKTGRPGAGRPGGPSRASADTLRQGYPGGRPRASACRETKRPTSWEAGRRRALEPFARAPAGA
jgi:hypothetical protein